jgi:hypothetical protein
MRRGALRCLQASAQVQLVCWSSVLVAVTDWQLECFADLVAGGGVVVQIFGTG